MVSERTCFILSPQKKGALVSPHDQTGAVSRFGEVLQDVDPQEIKAGHTHTHSHSIFPEVHDELLGFGGVECQVVVHRTCSQQIHLLPVGQLIAVLVEANHGGVVRKLDDVVGAWMYY